MDAAGQPATAAWGALFVAAASELGDAGANEHGPACAPALAAFEGEEAVARAAALLRLPGRPRSNRPHPSSVPALASAPVGASRSLLCLGSRLSAWAMQRLRFAGHWTCSCRALLLADNLVGQEYA